MHNPANDNDEIPMPTYSTGRNSVQEIAEKLLSQYAEMALTLRDAAVIMEAMGEDLKKLHGGVHG